MTPSLKFSQLVVDKLVNLRTKCSGNVYGIIYKNNLLILGLEVETVETPSYTVIDLKSEVALSFPTEVDKYGVFSIDMQHSDNVKMNIFQDVDVTDNPIYITRNLGEDNIAVHYVVHDRVEVASYQVISEEDIYSQFAYVRVKAQAPLISDLSPEAITEAITVLRKHSTSGQIAFNFSKTNIYLMGSGSESGLTGLSGNPSVGELCVESSSNCVNLCSSTKRKKERLEIDILRVNMLKKATRDVVSDGTKVHAPVVHVDRKSRQYLIMVTDIDSLAMVHKETKLINLYDILIESICRHLRLLTSMLLKHVEKNAGDHSNISYPQTYHFFPEMCGHFVTRIYAKNDCDAALEAERTLLHEKLFLPNQPCFKRANRFIFKGDVQGSAPLINPHEGLSSSGNGGEVTLVRGKYSYYHYSQDNMDDDGWGCAYRSLQTLASWYRLQGYTDELVPTFEEIQKCLVDIGDKPFSFIGSKQWIGSTEVNYVLNSLLNVTSKILYVSSGEELGSKGPELVHHFATQGSPVMIGGGVLAHTILGVDYNKQSGSLKFLILDPHYTGSENLYTIQHKGWCGWKGVIFWNKNAYYNMCLPHVPHCV